MPPVRQALCTVVAVYMSTAARADPIPVEVVQGPSGWQLIRGGAPYRVQGAGGDGPLDQLAAAGGNSVRTWGTDGVQARLDEAERLGLTVAVGIWLGHPRHGFDYSDPQQVADQKARVREDVLRFKDHPAVLLWGLGNEMEGFGQGDDPAIWAAVEDIAAMVQELDPNHPTMTVTAEIGGARVASVRDLCPSIDIHGINSYGGAASLATRYRAAGGARPYLVTEFGPNGTWESATTPWGAPLEPTSTEKAEAYTRAWNNAVLQAPDLALGGYAFTWGTKMEATATWFGMFLADGQRTPAIDAMTLAWTGHLPEDRSPVLTALTVEGGPVVAPGARLTARVQAEDPEGASLTSTWVLRPEDLRPQVGGDARHTPAPIPEAILSQQPDQAELRMPKVPGAYRLHVTVSDGTGQAAVASAPLQVEGTPRIWLPHPVFTDTLGAMSWVPSGWMGASDALSLRETGPDEAHSGRAALRLTHDGVGGWGAIAWQDPPSDWGDRDGGLDLTGARYLEFWARGAVGGEPLVVTVGLIGDDKPFPDTAHRSRSITLKSRWERYRIPLRGLDLTRVRTPFVVTVPGAGAPREMFLDDVAFHR